MKKFRDLLIAGIDEDIQGTTIERLVTVKTIFEDEIADELEVCTFCGTEIGSDFNYRGCCGEVRSETLYLLVDGEDCLQSEVIVKIRPLSDDQKEELENDKKLDLYRDK